MPSTMEGERGRWSRARKLTMGAAVVSVGSVVVALTLPVTVVSWGLGALAGATAMLAFGAARRMREVARDVARREAEREALVTEQRRARTLQAEALARLDSRPPPSSGPISTIPPSGPISSTPSGPISSVPSGPISSHPAARTLPSVPPLQGPAALERLPYDVPQDRPSGF